MLKTASAFFSDTAEKHASAAPASRSDHPISTCSKVKADMLEFTKTFLKPVCFPNVFAAVVDFADLSSDSECSGYSETFPSELNSLE
jgi:hypothetical protein